MFGLASQLDHLARDNSAPGLIHETHERSLDLDCVAEGVEDQQSRDALVALGCATVQGYFFGRPVREVDFMAELSEHTEAIQTTLG